MKEVNYNKCTFETIYSKCETYENLYNFGKELKELMKKYKIKEITPTHRSNAQISRHLKDDELHIVGMYFKREPFENEHQCVCISNVGYEDKLTVGKVYNDLWRDYRNDDWITIIDDNIEDETYPSELFKREYI